MEITADYATAFALIWSMTFFMDCHTEISANTSTTLPWSVNGASCNTAQSGDGSMIDRPLIDGMSFTWAKGITYRTVPCVFQRKDL